MANSKFGCNKVKQKALIVDSFGQPFMFFLPNGQKMYKSLLGAILTVIIFTVVSFYALYKWQLLIGKEEARTIIEIEEDYFRANNSFIDNKEDGFNIAVGMFNLFGAKIEEDFEQYGTLDVIYETIDRDKVGLNAVTLSMRSCTSRDMYVEGDTSDQETNFWPVKDTLLINIKAEREKLRCIDETNETIEITGALNEDLQRRISVTF